CVYGASAHPHLPSFPTRRSSDLIAAPGHLLLIGLADVLQQPTDDEALAITQLDRGARAPHDQRRDRRQAGPERDRMTDIELAHYDRKRTRLNSCHRTISYAVFCL